MANKHNGDSQAATRLSMHITRIQIVSHQLGFLLKHSTQDLACLTNEAVYTSNYKSLHLHYIYNTMNLKNPQQCLLFSMSSMT